MHQLSYKWYLYWAICCCLGIASGFGYLHFTRIQPVVSSVPVTTPSPAPMVQASQVSSPVTILFVGDVMLGRSVNKNIVSRNDPTWPFHNVALNLSSADITYINLESPLIYDCPLTDSGLKFCGDSKNVQGLVLAGVDVASLANNHSTNYGNQGLTTTIEILQQSGIAPVGLGSPVSIVRHGQLFTFLSFNDVGHYPGIDNVNLDTLSEKVKKAKIEGSVLIVTFHWGNEYESLPTPRQKKLAHLVIDAGADLVIGAHPHWIQTKEVYLGKPIYYSLGNFVFDQEWSEPTKCGLAVIFTYLETQLIDTQERAVFIQNYGQPSWN